MTNYPQQKCSRCGDEFMSIFSEQRFCNKCRRMMIHVEDAGISRQRKREQELAQRVENNFNHLIDVLIIDEWGHEVWALDLAKRYRKELNARQHRDFRHRK